jgi:mannose-6-phosphate isomerase-like protein (cupin superfamily)
MADFTVVRAEDVPSMAAEVGMDPEHFDVRFLREALGLETFALTVQRFAGDWKPTRGHRHRVQEEAYVLVSGRAEAKLDDEVVELEPMTVVRVPPQTARAVRAAGDEEAVFVIVAAPQAGFDDVEFIPDFWVD